MTADLSPAERATVDRIEQAPDALAEDALTYLPICGPCVRGEGSECHTPECALFLRDVPPDGLIAEFALDQPPTTAPDALGLREEVAEALRAHRYQGSFLNSWCTCGNVEPIRRDPETGHRPAVNVAALHREHLADALLPLLERREAEAAKRALRDAADAWETDVTDPTPRMGSRADGWLRDRADRIGGTR